MRNNLNDQMNRENKEDNAFPKTLVRETRAVVTITLQSESASV